MQYGVQMKGVIDVLRCSRCKVLFRGVGELMSCVATYCLEEVAGLMSCDSDAT